MGQDGILRPIGNRPKCRDVNESPPARVARGYGLILDSGEWELQDSLDGSIVYMTRDFRISGDEITQNQDVIREFLIESHENLSRLDQELVHREPVSRDPHPGHLGGAVRIGRVDRTLHIGGAAGEPPEALALKLN